MNRHEVETVMERLKKTLFTHAFVGLQADLARAAARESATVRDETETYTQAGDHRAAGILAGTTSAAGLREGVARADDEWVVLVPAPADEPPALATPPAPLPPAATDEPRRPGRPRKAE